MKPTRIGERLFVVIRDVFAEPDGRQFVLDHEDKPGLRRMDLHS
jgi:hypothetical protein